MNFLRSKAGVGILSFVLAVLLSAIICVILQIMGFDDMFVNLMGYAIIFIALMVLLKALRKVLLNEGDISDNIARYVVWTSLVLIIVLGAIAFFTLNRTFKSDYEKLSEDIEILNKQCPIKSEDGEMKSAVVDGNTLVFNYIIYEYRELYIERLEGDKEGALDMLNSNAPLLTALLKNKMGVRFIYTGDRSHEKLTIDIPYDELSEAYK